MFRTLENAKYPNFVKDLMKLSPPQLLKHDLFLEIAE